MSEEQIEEHYWAVVQTVSRMEHIVRRDIEKTNHSAFIPTYAKHRNVDGAAYVKEHPLFTGYVFFLTKRDDLSGLPDITGIPDIHGVYRVLPCGVRPEEMVRVLIEHTVCDHDFSEPPRYTRYYRPPTKKAVRYRSRKPRPSKRARSVNTPQSPHISEPEQISHVSTQR